ncbi:hypothetical protein ACOME3_001644 [Neoechinorhynchus agilis]
MLSGGSLSGPSITSPTFYEHNFKRNCSSPRTSISMFWEQNPNSSSSSLSSSGDFVVGGFSAMCNNGNGNRAHSPMAISPSGRLSPVCNSRRCNWASVLNDRFPITKAAMQRKLKDFIAEQSDLLASSSSKLKDASARFGHIQLLELAKDCLRRAEIASIADQFRCSMHTIPSSPTPSSLKLSKTYFADLQDKLQRLVEECECKILSHDAFQHLKSSVNKLLLAISRTANLVECLDQDPDQMYRTLGIVENTIMSEATSISKLEIARYITSQLIDSSLVDLSRFDKEPTPEKFSNIEKVKMPSQRDFRVLRTLSSGAYGSVCLVTHEKSKTKMAMKKMSKSMIRLKNVAKQVITERDILSFTKNPFVVSLFCSFETSQHLYLIMEYVEGGDVRTLLDSLETYTLPLDLAAIYMAETSLAIEYVHSFGIIHRDLKRGFI